METPQEKAGALTIASWLAHAPKHHPDNPEAKDFEGDGLAGSAPAKIRGEGVKLASYEVKLARAGAVSGQPLCLNRTQLSGLQGTLFPRHDCGLIGPQGTDANQHTNLGGRRRQKTCQKE